MTRRIETTIHLKTGGQIIIPLEEINMTRSAMTGELTEMKWTHLDDPSNGRIQYLNLSEVAAITTVRKDTP